MKKAVLLLLVALFQMYKICGQTPVCIPDIAYKDSTAGIYPKPYNDSTKLGGIPKIACIDNAYEVPLTVNIPDMVTIPFNGTTVTLGLESAKLDTLNAVVGLPKGIKYYCSPGNCIFEKNKLGCVVLKGIPTADNNPGNYDLLINLKLVTFLGTFDVTFPGSIFPGKYFITVAPKNSGACLTSDLQNASSFQGNILAYPNPVKNELSFTIAAVQAGNTELTITDIMGRPVLKRQLILHQGGNEYTIRVDGLNNGIYYYTLSQHHMATSKKFLVFKD